MHLAHVVNTIESNSGTPLSQAQGITLESMERAAQIVSSNTKVDLFSISFEEDNTALPQAFYRLPDLESSAADHGHFAFPRKLPLLREILESAASRSTADYLIYTNIDISVQPFFYDAVSAIIDSGIDSFIVNRRTISAEHITNSMLPLMYAQLGESHPGYDCFIFPRGKLKSFELGKLCIGAPGVGLGLMLNMYVNDRNFSLFEDFHLTFHIGDDKFWKNEKFADIAQFNQRELLKVVEILEKAHGEFDASLPGWGYSTIKSIRQL